MTAQETVDEVVLLPGMLCDERIWHPVASRLDPAAKVRLLRTDEADSVAQLAQRSLELLGGGRAAVVGFSFGGHVALEMLRQAPEVVAAVGIVGCGAGSLPASEQARFRGLARELTRGGEDVFDQVRRPFGATMLGPDAGPEAAGIVEAMAQSVGPEGLARQLTAQCTRPDSAGTIATATVPLFFGAGRQDAACPPGRVAQLAATATGSLFVEGAGSGHCFPLEEPDVLAAALNDWLERTWTM